jgi:hypothetical protein
MTCGAIGLQAHNASRITESTDSASQCDSPGENANLGGTWCRHGIPALITCTQLHSRAAASRSCAGSGSRISPDGAMPNGISHCRQRPKLKQHQSALRTLPADRGGDPPGETSYQFGSALHDKVQQESSRCACGIPGCCEGRPGLVCCGPSGRWAIGQPVCRRGAGVARLRPWTWQEGVSRVLQQNLCMPGCAPQHVVSAWWLVWGSGAICDLDQHIDQ